MLERAGKKVEIVEKKSINHNNKYTSNIWIYVLVIFWVIFLSVIIAILSNSDDSVNSKSTNQNKTKDYCPNGDYSPSVYDGSCGKKVEENICRWSDGRYYDKPKNSYCDDSQTPQWWSCVFWYTAKSEWNRAWDHSARYCECNKTLLSCSAVVEGIIDNMQSDINFAQNYLNNMYVNTYSQASVNQYNNQVQYVNNLIWKRNRYMSEHCKC